MTMQARVLQGLSQLMSLNMLMWLTMLTLFAGIVTLAGAVYLAIAAVLAPALAGLLAGVSLLAVFVLLAVAVRLVLRAQAEPPEPTTPAEPRVDNVVAQNLRPVIGDQAVDWTRSNTDIVIAGALVAGVALAASPKLRRFVVRSTGPIVTRKAIRAAQDLADR